MTTVDVKSCLFISQRVFFPRFPENHSRSRRELQRLALRFRWFHMASHLLIISRRIVDERPILPKAGTMAWAVPAMFGSVVL